MSDRPSNPVREGRKPYGKPVIRRILLRPEEAVLGACKTSGGNGAVMNQPCLSCSTAGS